jgi:type IV pilus assembly protein PilB
MAVRLAELLLKEKRITPAQLQEALDDQKASGSKLGTALVRAGLVSDAEITTLLSRQYGVPSIDLTEFEIDPAVIRILPAETAQKYLVLPICRSGSVLTIAMADPTDVFALDDIRFMTGYNVEPVVAAESALLDALAKYYETARPVPNPASSLELATRALEELPEATPDGNVEVLDDIEEIDVGALEKQGAEAPVIRLVNLILMSAIQRTASDIHIEPYERESRIRFRIDGTLYHVMSPPLKYRDAIVSRLKIMSKLDIAEKRLPQDGRIKIRFTDAGRLREIDFRMSCLPTLFGEKIVLRILDKEKLMLDMTRLGFEASSLARFETAIQKPWGMVLVTGPTGSGKTNTLYSSISRINTPETNIMTAEDPVEFNLPGVNQVQVREAVGLTFAAALRSFLRQDPNIILVGEVRDFETAEIAVKAALTGHLVLSTLHTNDAPSTINRLMNMGIEPFLVASSVNLICAQRLIRRVCQSCRVDHPEPVAALIDVGFDPDEAATLVPGRGTGCAACNQTGYKGRVGLYEVMEISDEIRELILVGASSLELRRKAVELGMLTLRMSGLQKIRDGITTIEEVVRETVK